jgi:hypothetical protein
MNKEISGFGTLKGVVTDVLVDLFNGDTGRYFQFLRWAVRGYQQLKLQVLTGNKSIELTPNENPYCVVLPNDYLNFVAIGINRGGRFMRFHEEPRMATTTSQACGKEVQAGEEEQPAVYPSNVAGAYYTYKIDEQNNRILLQGYPILDQLTLIYVSSGVKVGEQTYIPAVATEAIIAFIHWQYAQFNPNATNIDKAETFARWSMEVKKIQRLNINIDNLYDAYFAVVDKRY